MNKRETSEIVSNETARNDDDGKKLSRDGGSLEYHGYFHRRSYARAHTHTQTHTHTHTSAGTWEENPMAYVSRHGIGSRRECKSAAVALCDGRQTRRQPYGRLYEARKYNRNVPLEHQSFVLPWGWRERKSISDGGNISAHPSRHNAPDGGPVSAITFPTSFARPDSGTLRMRH